MRATAIVVVVGLLLTGTACSGRGGGGSPAQRAIATSPPAVPPGHSPAVVTTRGPQPPATGAWLGAWVKPQWATPAGRAEAFTAFEKQAGTELTIAHMFRDWNDDFPGPAEDALLGEADLLMISWAGTDTRSTAMGV